MDLLADWLQSVSPKAHKRIDGAMFAFAKYGWADGLAAVYARGLHGPAHGPEQAIHGWACALDRSSKAHANVGAWLVGTVMAPSTPPRVRYLLAAKTLGAEDKAVWDALIEHGLALATPRADGVWTALATYHPHWPNIFFHLRPPNALAEAAMDTFLERGGTPPPAALVKMLREEHPFQSREMLLPRLAELTTPIERAGLFAVLPWVISLDAGARAAMEAALLQAGFPFVVPQGRAKERDLRSILRCTSNDLARWSGFSTPDIAETVCPTTGDWNVLEAHAWGLHRRDPDSAAKIKATVAAFTQRELERTLPGSDVAPRKPRL